MPDQMRNQDRICELQAAVAGLLSATGFMLEALERVTLHLPEGDERSAAVSALVQARAAVRAGESEAEAQRRIGVERFAADPPQV